MESARNKAPKAPRGECEEGCPLPTGGWVWRGGMPLPSNYFSIFELKTAIFGAFWG